MNSIFTGIFLLCFVCTLHASEEAKIDSLLNLMASARHDTDRIKLWIDIGWEAELLSPDTGIYYYRKAHSLADSYLSKSANAKNDEYFRYLLYAGESMYKAGTASAYAHNADGAIKWNTKAVFYLEEYLQKYPANFDAGYKISQALLNIGNGYSFTEDYNNTLVFYNQALAVEKTLMRKFPGEKKIVTSIKKCYNNISIVHSYMGNYTAAIQCCDTALEVARKMNDSDEIAHCYINYGVAYAYQCVYEKALEYNQKALKIKEELERKDPGNMALKKSIGQLLSNMGLIYSYNKYYENSLEYFRRSLEIKKKLNNAGELCDTYINMAGLYFNMKNMDKALEFYQTGMEYALKADDKSAISNAYQGIGIVYSTQGDNKNAIKYISLAIDMNEKLNNRYGLAMALNNISKDYCALNDYKKAIESAEKALKIGQETGAGILIKDAYSNLIDAYEGLGNFKKGFEYFKLYNTIKDSLFNEEKSNQISEMESRYQSEKKQYEIDKLTKEKELQATEIALKNEEVKKQRILILSFIAGFVIILVFSVIVFRLFVAKKRANQLLAQKNADILQKNEEIISQRDEIEAQKNLVTLQKNQIEEIHHELRDSIFYAERIQRAVLPSLEFVQKHLSDTFILFRPKNIVSGDFYWIKLVETICPPGAGQGASSLQKNIIFCVADCTGHGVPGALMSMMSIAFLNEISNKEINQAAQILERLRINIINALKQQGISGEQKDGLDIALCILEPEANNLQFAGANNPIYIAKNVSPLGEVKHLEEWKADKMPISIYEMMSPFTNHLIPVAKGDSIYLFTDGLPDQFGGNENKKFKYSGLKELLLSVQNVQMNRQREIIVGTLDKWMGGVEQIDDITVWGIKI